MRRGRAAGLGVGADARCHCDRHHRGASLFGGWASVTRTRTLTEAALIAVLCNGLAILNVDFNTQQIVGGALMC